MPETIKVASRSNARERHLIFPETLSENRYVALTFYSSNPVSIDNAKKESSKNGELSVGGYIASAVQADSKLLTSAVEIGGKTINAFEKSIKSGETNVAGVANAVANATSAASELALTRSAVTDKDFEFGIYLPLTNQLRESMSQEYDSKTQGLVAGKLSSLMDTINKASPVTVQQLGNQFGSRTLLVNPDYVQNYKGPGMRELTLNWSLLPNNQQEATNIFKIIKQLKMAASPQIAKDIKSIMFSPMFCSVTFENEKLDDMVRFDEMVISNISVNYSESGFMETFKDGMPKSVNLSVTMSERRMKTADDWSDKEQSRKTT